MSEEALWNNSFYSLLAHISQSSLANHISTLRRSVALPHLTLSNSIAAGALEGSVEKDVLNQKTSFMSASPSMKALESMMNSREPHADNIPEAIQEEDELPPMQTPSVFDKPPFNANYTYNGLRVLLQNPAPPDASTATFHTAKSSESVDASPKRHRYSSSISTIGESGYSMGTPKLDPPATFYSVKRPTKDYLPQLLTVLGPRKNLELDQDTTVVEEHEYSSYPAPAASSSTLPQTKELPNPPQLLPQALASKLPVRPVKSLLPPEPESLQPPFQLAPQPAQKSAKPKTSATVAGLPRPSPKKLSSFNAVSKWLSSAFGTPKSSISRQQDQKSEAPAATPSNSQAPRSPIRSSTMGDIHAAAERRPEQSKRFSFRGLFKKKNTDQPSRPAKIKAKSFSTPSFSALRETKEPKESKEPKELKEHKSNETKSKLKESKEPTKTKRKDKEKNLFAGFKRKKSDGQIVSLGEPETKPPKAPQTPTTPGSFAEVDTPATNTLEPENDKAEDNRNTIREVDDSDYNFEYSKNGVEDDSANLAADPPQRHSHENFGEELALEPIKDLQLPDFRPSDNSFGLPLLKYRFNETPRSRPPQSNRLSLNPPKSDQLLGEALFPKLLNPHEIESIVSLERSRSMRSIRSNGKRSSFINYNGSDENVIVYSGEAGQNSPRSVKRSGSILKNSLSMSSLNGVVQLIDQTVANSLPSPVEVHEPEELEPPGLGLLPTLDFQSFSQDGFSQSFNNDTENLHDFIEFSDFIDVDNLEFPSSPAQSLLAPREMSLPSVQDLGEFNFGSDLQDPATKEGAPHKDKNIQGANQPNEETFEEPARSVPSPKVGSESAPDREDSSIQEIGYQQAAVAEQASKPAEDSAETEPSLMITDAAAGAPDSELLHEVPSSDALTKLPILGTAYQLAMNEAVARELPSNAARPISMSFKGFNGPAISKQAIAKTGSHQLLNMGDSSNESSAVGQGFGLSDESDEDIYLSDEELENDIGHGFSVKKPAQAPGLKTTGNAANRALPSPKMLGLQPPTGPFYHDRIPSLSDQSAASSPRSLTSFISRIRKLPMASPKIVQKQGGVRFSSRIILYDTYNGEEYDRHPDIGTCNQLTPLLAQQIREELNQVKSEMEVHQDSQCYTHFF